MIRFLLGASMLAIVSGLAAQPSELRNAHVVDQSNIEDPQAGIDEYKEGWIAFSVPALTGSKSPCCWKGAWDGTGEAGCSLENEHQSYGTRSNSPLVENLVLYANLSDNVVTDLRMMGDHCPVDAAGKTITWLGSVDTDAGLDWLHEIVDESESDDIAHSALFALGWHGSRSATDRLEVIARSPAGNMAEQAVFWLGEARGEGGYTALNDLLEALPDGATRRSITFALAQNDTPAAVEKLEELAKFDHDRETRGLALFWLAEEYPERAEPVVLDVLKGTGNEDLVDEAVFALSQLPDDRSGPALLALAKDDSQSRHVRQQALFWLANSDESNVDALIDLLTN